MAIETSAGSGVNVAEDMAPASRVEAAGATWGLTRSAAGPRLVVQAPPSAVALLSELEGETSSGSVGTLLVGPLSPKNAAVLRARVPGLAPEPVRLRTSAGLGDRLGLATPGHVRALRAAGGDVVPVFAQQSIREMTRTGRTPLEVMDAATWGAFETGWRQGMGADADHLKTTDDIDACLAAGFTWFTIDPGAHVDGTADTALPAQVSVAVDALPWAALDDSRAGLLARYAAPTIDVEGHVVRFSDEIVLRAAAKYGRAVAHVATMYRHLAAKLAIGRFDLEVSVDETDTPTTAAEHIYVAKELRRLGVQWASLAPRFVGRFEKGVDYIGDIPAFEAEFAVHAAIARQFGPYKISLHSGSDKFSIYPIAAAHTRGLVHLKTAGTSYLEAVRTIGQVAPALFRDIYAFALERYDEDKATYHVSAEASKAPKPSAVSDADLPGVLDQFDARQVLHVTFGSVLTTRTADGRLRLCLLREGEVDLLKPLRSGATLDQLRQLILDGIWVKPWGHGLEEGLIPLNRVMSEIGG